jgi:hypothetical protein
MGECRYGQAFASLVRQIVPNSLPLRSAAATVPKVIGFDTVGEGRMRRSAGYKRASDTVPNTENGTVVALRGREGAHQGQD